MLNRIKKLCDDRDITIAELERISGITRGTIGRWDTKIPSVDKVSLVAKALNVSLDYIIGTSDIENPDDALKILGEKGGLYLHLAQKAKKLDLSKNDVNMILDIIEKYKKGE